MDVRAVTAAELLNLPPVFLLLVATWALLAVGACVLVHLLTAGLDEER